MKLMNKIALGSAALLLVAAAVQPAMAACGGAPILSTNDGAGKSFIYTEGQPAPAITGASDNTNCLGSGCYAPNMINPTGFFWAQGTGDTALAAGNDNGTFDIDQWANNDPLFGPGLVTDYLGLGTYFYASYINTTWAVAGIDGCVLADGLPSQCTCMVLTDQNADVAQTWADGQALDGKNGYVAVLGNVANSSGNTFLNRVGGAPIVLRSIGAPQIIDTQRNPGNFNLDLVRVNYDFPANADYTRGGCECAPDRYLVYQWQENQTGDTTTRNPGAGLWALMNTAGGGAQPAGGTPIGQSVDLESACGGATTKDVFISARLIWGLAAGGGTKDLVNTWLGTDSTRVECGEFFTEPQPIERPRVRPDKQLRPARTGR